MAKLKFIDLFAGLGGFHIGLERLGHKCVYACEIDKHLNEIYRSNFETDYVDHDIIKADLKKIKKLNYDLLCAGFPCQPFSKAGTQSGFDHKIAGSMFSYIMKFVQAHKPKYLMLENVPNLYGHNKGKTYGFMKRQLEKAGYYVEEEQISPIQFGIPQTRLRLYILAIKKNGKNDQPMIKWPKLQNNIKDRKPTTNLKKYFIKNPYRPRILSKEKKLLLKYWEDFLKRIPKNETLYNPLWIAEFGATYPFEKEAPRKLSLKKLQQYKGTLGVNLKNKSKEEIFDDLLPPYATYSRSRNESIEESYEFPEWKKIFIKRNRDFYKRNKKWIDPWLKKYKFNKLQMFKEPTHRKFEWNCFGEEYTLKDKVISFRGSGVRVKRMNAAPTLIHAAVTQLPYIPMLDRYLSIEECLKIQGFKEKRIINTMKNKGWERAFKAIGNAVNADVVEKIGETFLNGKLKKTNYRIKPIQQNFTFLKNA